jgi:peroxiredoxin
MTIARLATALALAATLAACGERQPAAPAAATGVEYGTYRAVLAVKGGDLPFGLELAHEDGKDVAYLLNGPERARVSDVRIDGSRIELLMPGYGNRIEARRVGSRLEGSVILLRPGGVLRKVPFVAEHGAKYRFFPEAGAGGADVSGRWAMTMTGDAGNQSFAIGEFQQSGHRVSGTIRRASGDDRYLEGEVRGDTLFLSRFDGGSAHLHKARLNERGELVGEFWSGGGAHQSWVARRDANARLEDPAQLSKLKPGVERIEFTFPDVDGRPVSLADERFRGKVLVVTIGGTWCPNCHDETAFLVPFYTARRAAGLEVVGVMFEYFPEPAQANSAVRRFQQTFSVNYPLLLAGTTEKDDIAAKLPMIEKLYAYPTTIVIDRKGRVRQVHAGFSGPATGAAYEEWQREFTALIDRLLAERA